jgi:hypothetical protein
MALLKGKQIADSSIADGKLEETYTNSDGTVAFTGDQAMGSNKLTGLANGTDSGDAVNKGQLDSAVAGLNWLDPVEVNGYIGTASITEINALSPSSGDTVAAEDAGTPTAGTSDALVAGDLAEYNGTEWKKILDASGGFVPDGTRAIVSTTGTFVTGGGLTGSTDEGKIATWDGTAVLHDSLLTPTDGEAALVKGEASVNENNGFVFDGTVPTGSWVQFTSVGGAGAGAGLTQNGGNLDVNAGDGLQIGGGIGGADEVNIDVSDFAGSGLEDDGSENLRIAAAAAGDGLNGGAGSALSVDTGNGLKIDTGAVAVEPADIAGSGLEDDGSDNLRIAAAAAGDGITGGAGSALAVDPDGDSVSVGASGVKAAVPTTSDKAVASAATSGEAQDTGVNITSTPGGDGHVDVLVNGVQYELGDGVKTTPCYFSVDGGTTARAISAITAADSLYWNGTTAGFDLETSDDIDLNYNVA